MEREQETWKIRSACLELAKQVCPKNKDEFATVEDVIEAAKRLEKYIMGGK